MIYITPSDAIEYLYCPRFIYFERILMIPQNEQIRYKVQQGREIHHDKSKQNSDYLRKKLGVIDKQINVRLESETLHLKGEVDEILFLSDGTLAPLDYKFAEWKGNVYHNHKVQSILYSLLIKEHLKKEVNRGYLIYTRSKNHLEELKFTPQDFQKAIQIVKDIIIIIQQAKFPKRTKWTSRCMDCCYKNICIK